MISTRIAFPTVVVNKDDPTTAVQQQREARTRSGLSPLARLDSYCTSPTLHSALGIPGVQPPVELEDDSQEPWLARGAGRALQRIPCGAGPAGHGGLGGALPRPPAVSGRRGPSRHGREEWARPESARQHR
ncbi:unnamed protein product, partial [Ectocarpus sp. 12 AP-2014]